MPRSSKNQLRKVHAVVDRRDGGRCRRCGREVGEWFSRQHRIPRGAGGSARVDRPSNLITVCGSATSMDGCHNWMEHDIDPETEPVFVHEFGWVLLGDLGQITPCAAPHRLVT